MTMAHDLQLQNPNLFVQTAYIAGAPFDNTRRLEVVCPFTNEVFGSVPDLGEGAVDNAIAAAQDALPAWRDMTAYERGDILKKWGDLILQNKEDLARIMVFETGKPITQARSEVEFGASFVYWYAEEGKRAYGTTIPRTQDAERLTVLKQPIGVCAAITAWNFPLAMVTRKSAPALAAGCTVVVKPAEQTPFCALALAVLANEAGIPKGVFSILTGNPSRIGKQLCADERIRKLSFTGSTEVGKILMTQCAPSLKKVSFELGGNAPYIVFESADLDKAVRTFVGGKYTNCGQVCVAINRVFVHKSLHKAFVQKAKEAISKLVLGHPLDEATDVSSMIHQDAYKDACTALQTAQDEGARVVIGHGDYAQDDLLPNQFAPTLLDGVTDKMRIASNEIFAPIAPVLVFEDEDEVLTRANATEYGLASYFFSQDFAQSHRVAEALDFGMVGHNTIALSNQAIPFGGIKHSGFGREGGKWGLDEYLVTKYWAIDLG